MAGAVFKGRRLIKFLFLVLLLVLLFGGGAKMIVAGGAKSLNMADRLLGQGEGARLLLADQPYGRGPRQLLDIWVPDGIREGDRLPVIVFFYGGGWDSGERANYGFVGRALAQRGFVVVIPDYRLVPKAHWPGFIEDSAAAVAWTHTHIGSLAGDPDRIALMGHSAGAYNAAMLALDPQWMRGAKSDPSVIRGVAGLAGPYDFLPMEKGGRADKAMGKVKPAERTQPIAFARAGATIVDVKLPGSYSALRAAGPLVLEAEAATYHAQTFARGLRASGFDVLNDVVLNQVLVSFGSAEKTRAVIDRIQRDGTCWCGGTEWQGRVAMRISVSSWATTDEDVQMSLEAIRRASRLRA